MDWKPKWEKSIVKKKKERTIPNQKMFIVSATIITTISNLLLSVGHHVEKINIESNNHERLQKCNFSVLDWKYLFCTN